MHGCVRGVRPHVQGFMNETRHAHTTRAHEHKHSRAERTGAYLRRLAKGRSTWIHVPAVLV